MSCSIELNNEAVAYAKMNRYDEAMKCLNAALLYSSNLCDVESSASSQVKETFPQCHNIDVSGSADLEYDEGMATFCGPLHMSGQLLANPKLILVTIFYNLGIINAHDDQDNEAFAYFEKAKTQMLGTAAEFSSSVQGPSIIAILHNLGHIHYRAKRFDEAQQKYTEALNLARQKHNYYHLDIAASLNCIGVVCIHRQGDDTAEALGYLMEALAIRYAILDTKCSTDAATATVLNNVGRVRFVRKEFSEALKIYQEAFEIRHRIFGGCHLDVAATLFNAGQSHHLIGNVKEAETLYQKFLTMIHIILGENHTHIASALKVIALLYHERSEYFKATEFYCKALRRTRVALGLRHPEVASILNKIGNLCYERGDLDLSLQVYQEGLEIESEIYPENNCNIIVTLVNIARIHQRQGSFELALALYNKALKMQRARPGKEKRFEIAYTLSSIGLILQQMQRYSLAITVYTEALEIKKEELGENHFDISSVYNALGIAYLKLGQMDQSLEYFQRSLGIRQAQSSDPADVAVVLGNIGHLYSEIGEHDKAIEYFKQTLSFERASTDVNRTEIVTTLQRLGRLYQSRGDLNAALTHFEEGANICMMFPDNRPINDIASIIRSVGDVYLRLGDIENAMNAYVKASRINNVVGNEGVNNIAVNFNKLHKNSSYGAAAA